MIAAGDRGETGGGDGWRAGGRKGGTGGVAVVNILPTATLFSKDISLLNTRRDQPQHKKSLYIRNTSKLDTDNHLAKLSLSDFPLDEVHDCAGVEVLAL